MKSVTARILLCCLAALLCTFLGLMAVARVMSHVAQPFSGPDAARSRETALLASATQAYETGGTAKLLQQLDSIRRPVMGRYHLVDVKGRDLTTGGDLSGMIASLSPGEVRGVDGGKIVAIVGANDRYSLIWLSDWGNTTFNVKDALPYYLVVCAAVLGGLFWLLAWTLASPMRQLARTVEHFGAGDLTARVNATRTDEIGDLGRTFDRMAVRIASLLTAERRLLQDISHELRSPLARLSFAAELARSADDREAAVGKVKKEIGRLTNLVDSLIQVTRAEGDPVLEGVEPVRLGDLVRDIVEDCRARQETRIEVETDEEAAVRGNRELLRRAFENILWNAVRYAPAGSAVKVGIKAKGEAVRVDVRDFGPGVPAESLQKIFEPFFRVDPSRDSSSGGVGLGLAIAHRAVSLHHGRLLAENAQPGLRIVMELPRHVPR